MGLFRILKKDDQALPLPPPPRPGEKVDDLGPEPTEVPPFAAPQHQDDLDIEQPIGGRSMGTEGGDELHLQEEPDEEIHLPEMPEEPIHDLPEPELPNFQIPLPAEEKEAPKETERLILEEEPEKFQRELPKTAFIAVEDYQKIINGTNTIRARLMNAEHLLSNLNQIKTAEEQSFKQWRAKLEDVEKKLTYVDQVIAHAQR